MLSARMREEFSVAPQRQFDLGDEVAPLIVGEESLGSCRGEFHRQPDLARCPEHEAEFDIDPVARAEIAADVERQHAQIGMARFRGRLAISCFWRTAPPLPA